MSKRWLPAAVILALLTQVVGCYVHRSLPLPPTYRPPSWEPIVGLTTIEGEAVSFDRPAEIDGNTVRGVVEGKSYEVDLDEVLNLMIEKKRVDKPKSVLVGVILVVISVVVFRALG
jgi:hypothetical protein